MTDAAEETQIPETPQRASLPQTVRDRGGRREDRGSFAIFNDQHRIRVNCLKGSHDSSPPQVLKRMEDHLRQEELRSSDEAWLVSGQGSVDRRTVGPASCLGSGNATITASPLSNPSSNTGCCSISRTASHRRHGLQRPAEAAFPGYDKGMMHARSPATESKKPSAVPDHATILLRRLATRPWRHHGLQAGRTQG